ncbi:MAG TPA: OmpA family protein [Polyangiaceae bacterium]|nr:OmpA family protein [Polyangiaceae bacterium]
MAGSAHAQSGYFYLDRAQISGAPDDGFMVWRPYLSEKTRFYANAILGYSHNPLRSDTVTDDPTAQANIDNPVEGQFITYLSAGAEIANRLSVNLMIPIVAYEITGNDPAGNGVGSGGIGDNHVALSDIRLDARVRTWETDNHLFRVGGGLAAWLPTGNSTAFASDDQATGYIYGAAEFNFGKFFLAGNLGPQFRPERSIGGTNGALYLASELRYSGGLYLPLRDGRVRLGGELWGTTGLEDSSDHATFFTGKNTDVEWLAQLRYVLDERSRWYAEGGFGTRLAAGYGGPDFRMLIGIGTYVTMLDFESKAPKRNVHITPTVDDYDRDSDGDGYPDSIDKCPNEKEDGKPPDPTDGCPAASDRDGDGIPDSVDQCPDKPEDKDGIQDQDGCPEDDVDNDGIPDAEDKCPTQPGPRSSIAEKNGCPSLTHVTESGEVELLQPIEFETGKAVIKPGSFPILDEVVTLMKSRGSIKMGVYGHTDSRGIASQNLKLSGDRAASVVNYLVQHGIAASRLESQGFGQTKPIADNSTDAGRAKNRRVEFKILTGAD